MIDFNKYEKLVCFVARKHTVNEHDFEDLVNDIWVHLLKIINKYDEERGNLHTFICFQIHRGAIGSLRKRLPRGGPGTPKWKITKTKNIDCLNKTTQLQYNPSEKIIHEDLIFRISRYLSRLPGAVQNTIVYRMHGMTFKEISRLLGHSDSYHQLKFKEGIKSLKEMMQEATNK